MLLVTMVSEAHQGQGAELALYRTSATKLHRVSSSQSLLSLNSPKSLESGRILRVLLIFPDSGVCLESN